MEKAAIPYWRKLQRENFTQIKVLASFLQWPDSFLSQLNLTPRFVLNLPLRLAEKMAKGTLDDPIVRQFVPLKEETVLSQGFVLDPVQDQTFCKTEKLLHKYEGRALLLVTSACAMHCRYCFRQNFPYASQVSGYEKEIEEIRSNPSIEEVILSGGDPLSLTDRDLFLLLDQIERIPQVKRIRFHTRFPIGIPERIDDAFLLGLQKIKKQLFFVIHANHPKELDEEVVSALTKVRCLGIPVLNQAVLLRKVNDDESVLFSLCSSLVDHGILPYYLHQLDPVQGTSHFLVSDERALELISFLQKKLSGFAVPRLVREIPGKCSKSPIIYSFHSKMA